MPAYRPLVKVNKPVHKQIQVWPEGSSEALQDCFDTTDWNMFKQAATYNNTTDLQEYTETVTAYITKCIDDVTVTKTITVRDNQRIAHRFSDSRDTRACGRGYRPLQTTSPHHRPVTAPSPC